MDMSCHILPSSSRQWVVKGEIKLSLPNKFKLVTWNVNGIRSCSQKGLFEFWESESPDIFCLQETKAHPDQLSESLLAPVGWQAYWSSAQRKGYSGTAIYTKAEPSALSYGMGILKFDTEGRFVIADYGDFVLFNIYFPNGSAREERHLFKQEFLKKLNLHLKALIRSGREVIVVGDYNVAHLDIDVFDPKRLSSVSGFLPEERKWFGDFLDLGFVDGFRHFHPDSKDCYTWWSYRENARVNNRGWRIDHICVTKGMLKRLDSVRILPHQLGSDHCPVVAEFSGN